MTVVLGLVAGFFGLLGGLPGFLGPVVGVLGVVGSALLRSREPVLGGAVPLLPALVALAVLTGTAPAGPPTDLLAGLIALLLLLWAADDPARPAGGGRRAVPTVAPAFLAVGLAWVLSLALIGQPADIGLAGALLAAALVVLAFLFASLTHRPPSLAQTAGPPRAPTGAARSPPTGRAEEDRPSPRRVRPA